MNIRDDVEKKIANQGILRRLSTLENRQIWTLKSVRTINGLPPDDLGNIDISAGGGTWGSITGTLSNQTDLQSALGLKAPLASPTFGTLLTINKASGNPEFDFTIAGVVKSKIYWDNTNARLTFQNNANNNADALYFADHVTTNGNVTIGGIVQAPQVITTQNVIAASGNAATVPITYKLNEVTNDSAATLTITLTTASAVDGQMVIVKVLDFSGVAQTLAWVNTENSTVTAPATTNGSTTLPLTLGFMFNSGTTKWRLIAVA